MRIKNKSEKEATVTWNCSKEADVYLYDGLRPEIKKLIILGMVFLFIICLGVFGYLYRYFIIDLITNPSIQLSTNEIEVEVNSSVDLMKYVQKQEWPDRYKITYPDISNINTNSLGEYDLDFILHTAAKNSISTLKLKIVDTTPPVIELKEKEIVIHRGEEAENFNPKDYIELLSDNYYKEDEIELIYSTVFDWSKDNFEVEYIATDGSKNITTEILLVKIEDEIIDIIKLTYIDEENNILREDTIKTSDLKEDYNKYSKEIEGYNYLDYSVFKHNSQIESIEFRYEKITEEINNNENVDNENNIEDKKDNSQNSAQSSIQPVQPARGHYIDGTHDITLKKGSSFEQLAAALVSGVSSDEEIRILYGNITTDSLNTVGTYQVVYQTNSLSKTINVYITD